MTVYKNKDHTIIDIKEGKTLSSPDYNYIFDKTTGQFIRYGKTKEDNPNYSPFGPEIVDLEVTTICSGPKGKLCSFCYKSNNQFGKNMSFDTFKRVFDNLPKTVTQIAFGADASCTSNTDLFKMMEYCRDNGVIPNITVADITEDIADKLIEYCGAVAVSRYDDKNVCYDSIKLLTDKGMDQVNMHICIYEDNFEQVKETLKDIIFKTDERLSDLNAIVFLSLKNKGRGKDFERLSVDKFNEIVDTCLSYGVRFGFDSCSAVKFMNSIKGRENEKEMIEMTEPCESGKFSAYINVDGDYFPCSFIEGTTGWKTGLNVEYCNDFIDDIWNNNRNIIFRDKCNVYLDNGVACQRFII